MEEHVRSRTRMPPSQRTRRSCVLALLCCLATSRPARHAATAAVLVNSVAAFQPAVPPRPSSIRVDDVSHRYSVTWQRKLFSSVPRREHAVRNVTLSFGRAEPSPIEDAEDEGMTLLVGRSASGKSTLLRLIAGTEHPTAGRVSINGRATSENTFVGTPMPGLPSWIQMGAPHPLDVDGEDGRRGVRPVILQGKPAFDDTLTVTKRLVRLARDAARACNAEARGGERERRDRDAGPLLRALAGDFAALLALSPAQCAGPPSALSPAGEYSFALACGCLLSVAPAVRCAMDTADNDGVYYPILLLDELFDAEHSSTVEKCSRGIANLVRHGGVVVSATHRPEYFKAVKSRTVTLSGGRVLEMEARNVIV